MKFNSISFKDKATPSFCQNILFCLMSCHHYPIGKLSVVRWQYNIHLFCVSLWLLCL